MSIFIIQLLLFDTMHFIHSQFQPRNLYFLLPEQRFHRTSLASCSILRIFYNTVDERVGSISFHELLWVVYKFQY
ncbi:Uncharacterised protein [Mycobacteroides abscessus subsp. abscessus]|nr:Uncharacterised protein [Mycobacteroides abscessus subsp. abscessus]